MPWIKRNLFFVLSMAVGLILTGFCAFLFARDLSDNSSVNADFQNYATQYNQLLEAPVFPSDENINSALEDQKRATQFLADFRKVFVSPPPPPQKDERGFKTYLEESVVELRAAATNAGVQLPAVDYAFAFNEQQKMLNYPPENIPPWMQQLVEIKTLCGILFEARINSLESLQRVHVSDTDVGLATDYLEARITTNASQTQIITPYKITFRGFSREIAAVLGGLARSSNCFIVKHIDVSPSLESLAAPVFSAPVLAPAPAAPRNFLPPPRPYQRGEDPRDRRRDLREAPVAAPPPRPQPAIPFSIVPVTVLSERLLRVSISLDVVKLKGGGR
jgi:hypothetical protein